MATSYRQQNPELAVGPGRRQSGHQRHLHRPSKLFIGNCGTRLVDFYARDRNPTPGSDTQCREFSRDRQPDLGRRRVAVQPGRQQPHGDGRSDERLPLPHLTRARRRRSRRFFLEVGRRRLALLVGLAMLAAAGLVHRTLGSVSPRRSRQQLTLCSRRTWAIHSRAQFPNPSSNDASTHIHSRHAAMGGVEEPPTSVECSVS